MSDPAREQSDQGAMPQHGPAHAPMDRRSFLVWAAGASIGASAIFVGATVVQAMVPPARSIDGRKREGRAVVARMSDLALYAPRVAVYGEYRVFVVKTSGTQARVFDAACPHLGCELRFDETANEFICPCHHSAFTTSGTRLRGPARRNMVSAIAEIVDGDVVVSGFRA